MEKIILGRTDLKVSRLCLGTMQFGWTVDEPLSYQILDVAHERGINFIDTADIYSRWAPGNPGGVSETIIGRWLKRSQVPRDKIILATKVRGQMGDAPDDEGLSHRHILKAVEASLRRLGTDYIDLYQAHWLDENTPIEETLQTMDDLVKQGKVRFIGCSNYPAWRLTEAIWTSRLNNLVRYESLQPHYNLVHRAEFERELVDVCREYGLGIIPYSPLAGGFLTGKYQKDQPEPDSERRGGVRRRYYNNRSWKILAMVEHIAKAHHSTVSQVSLAWLLNKPMITSPIIGSRTLEQLQDNLGALDLQLSSDDISHLDQVSDWKNIED
jgi:aryl-alcohol dehydrogenase-like predicted oxidoreductase